MRLLKVEVLETLLYACVAWSPKTVDYDRLRKVHHKMLLCCLGGRKKKRKHHTLSYAHALVSTDSECVEAAVCRRGIRKSMVRVFRGTHGRDAPTDEGDPWRDGQGGRPLF